MLNCVYCDEPLLASEHPDLGTDGIERVEATHPECAFRMVAGSAAHQLGECTCFGGTREDPPGMSKREAARLALETYRLLQKETHEA